MATNGNNGLQPTEEIIKKFKEDLQKRVETAQSEKAAKTKERLTQDKIEQYKICQYVKAKETNVTYTNLRFFLSEGADRESQLIKTTVGSLKTKNVNLVSKIEALVAQIKTIRSAMTQAVEVACRFERSIEEEKRCKLDVYTALEAGVSEIWTKVGELKADTNDSFDKISKTFDGLVNISGILTFPNLDGLDAACANLTQKTAQLKADVEANISSSADKIKSASGELVTVQKTLGEIKFAKSDLTSVLKAKEDLKTFVETPNCPTEPLPVIEEACKQIQFENPETASTSSNPPAPAS